jgi:cell division septum initiation protein DivIVA
MNYDLATADELVAEAREARRRAEETARTYSWAAQQQEAAVKRSIAVPLGDLGNIDWQEIGLQRKRVEARRTLDRALEESGLAQKWAKAEQADAEVAQWFASDTYKTGGLGKLMKIGVQR